MAVDPALTPGFRVSPLPVRKILLSVGIAALVYFVLVRKGYAWTIGKKPAIPDTFENREWLARILMTEQSFYGVSIGYLEWAGIAWVAINRAEKKGKTIRQIVDSARWFGSTPPDRLYSDTLLSKGNGPAAVAFANRLFEGRALNPIAQRQSFLHPGGMKRCEAAGRSPGEVANDYICAPMDKFGYRWVPQWIVSPTQGGVAVNEPQVAGNAVFA